jgi:hypothetical protein
VRCKNSLEVALRGERHQHRALYSQPFEWQLMARNRRKMGAWEEIDVSRKKTKVVLFASVKNFISKTGKTNTRLKISFDSFCVLLGCIHCSAHCSATSQ